MWFSLSFHCTAVGFLSSLGLFSPQARRIPQYKQFLTNILECTPDEHDDRRKLKVVLERIEQVRGATWGSVSPGWSTVGYFYDDSLPNGVRGEFLGEAG